MARKRKTDSNNQMGEMNNIEQEELKEFNLNLVKLVNKKIGDKVAYNLMYDDDTPTVVKRWISTGSKQLDYIISNVKNGGLPEGRIIEVFGPPSCGKSHLAFEVVKNVQKEGGMALYFDTENATSVENLQNLGINVGSQLIFAQPKYIEELFDVMEMTINIVKENWNKEAPFLIVWDSVPATPTKAEYEGAFTDNLMGVQARVIGKGIRKIVNMIADKRIVLLLLNQQRMKLGVTFGDPYTTPGGLAIPYASSVRIQLSFAKQVKDANGNAIGICVDAKTVKNKVSVPYRSVSFEIHFGKGIVEHEHIFDYLQSYCSKQEDNMIVLQNGMRASLCTVGAWKQFNLYDQDGVEIVSKSFRMNEFADIMAEYKDYFEQIMDAAYIIPTGNSNSLEPDSKNENQITDTTTTDSEISHNAT